MTGENPFAGLDQARQGKPPGEPSSANGHKPLSENDMYLLAHGLAPVPPYPSGEVGGPLGALVSSSSLPDALLGGAGLAVLAALCGNAELELPGGDACRPAIWVPLIAPNGGAKTPVMRKRALAPLYPLDAAAGQDYRQQAAQRAAAPRDERGEMPADPALIISDVTIEALARILDRREDHGGCALIFADELGSFLSSLGQYKKGGGSDKARFMDLWNADEWLVQRVGSGTGTSLGVDIRIPRTCVSVLGGIQPALLGQLGDEVSGMRGRWLPHYSDVQNPSWDEWSAEGRAGWAQAITAMHTRRTLRRRWQLSDAARVRWREAQAEWKQRGRAEPDASVQAALAKADIHAARIALVLAESRASSPPGLAAAVPGAAMTEAIAITGYCIEVFRMFGPAGSFALSPRDEKRAAQVETLRAWLEARPGKKAGTAAILRGKVAGARTVDERDELVKAYEKVYEHRVRFEQIRGNLWGTIVYAPSCDPDEGHPE